MQMIKLSDKGHPRPNTRLLKDLPQITRKSYELLPWEMPLWISVARIKKIYKKQSYQVIKTYKHQSNDLPEMT